MQRKLNSDAIWKKDDDFSAYFIEADMKHLFKNSETGEKIFICHEINKEHLLTWYHNPSDAHMMKKLLETCHRNKIPAEDKNSGDVFLNSNNRTIITRFINTIAERTSIAKSSLEEILSVLPSNLKEGEFKPSSTSAPNWIKEHYVGSCYLYKNLNRLSDKEQVYIGNFGKINDILMYYQNNELDNRQFWQQCIKEEIPVERQMGYVTLNSKNKKILTAFINEIDKFTPISTNEKNEMLASLPDYLINEEFRKQVQPTGSFGLFKEKEKPDLSKTAESVSNKSFTL